jgi:hypothetical protein
MFEPGQLPVTTVPFRPRAATFSIFELDRGKNPTVKTPASWCKKLPTNDAGWGVRKGRDHFEALLAMPGNERR